jgi:hypothetical protein
MAISSKTYDYTGRKKDISILLSANPSVVGKQQVTVGIGKKGKFCAGIQKVIQKYAVILLTNLKSQENFPDFGTSFLYSLNSGINPIDKIAVTQLFNLASYKTVNTLLDYQIVTRGIPDDEKIDKAYLRDIVLSYNTVSFDVQIEVASGDSTSFLIPLPE